MKLGGQRKRMREKGEKEGRRWWRPGGGRAERSEVGEKEEDREEGEEGKKKEEKE